MSTPMNRRAVLGGFLLLVCVALLLAAPARAQDATGSRLEQEIAGQAVAAIPADLKMATVGIGQIEGDGDGRIAHALTGALARLNRFKVIERRDLDKLLEEQGVQARDWTDPKARVKFGKVKGVQGLFLGQVERSDGWFRDTLTVQLKLADVESGQIVLAKELSTSRWHWGPVAVVVLVVLVVLGLVLSVAGRKATVAKKIELAETDQRERTINTEELSKAIDELGRAQDVLARERRNAEAARIKRLREDLRTLRDTITGAPTGAWDGRSAGDLRRAIAFDQTTYRTLVEAVTQGASSLCDHVGGGDPARVDQDIQTITDHIRSAEASFRGRGV